MENPWQFMFGVLILLLFACGVVINISALVILSRKRCHSMFHQLLRILSVYDVIVVACSAVSYGADNVLWDVDGDRPEAFLKLKVGQ
jgi:hypothetical protein